MRIISTVPSLTELLSHLGLDDEIVGITKFCIHPEHIFRHKTRIGGTKDLKLDLIRSLKPDLIIANKEENDRSQIEELQKDSAVLLTDISDLDSALSAIVSIGERTGKQEEALTLSKKINQEFENLIPSRPRKVLYLIWQEPYMSVGKDTFIHDMLLRCGFENVTGSDTRYPEVNASDFDPELILLSSEPFPFKEKHMAVIRSHWPKAEIKLVDGEYFSWYGSRMLGASSYFKELMNELKQNG